MKVGLALRTTRSNSEFATAQELFRKLNAAFAKAKADGLLRHESSSPEYYIASATLTYAIKLVQAGTAQKYDLDLSPLAFEIDPQNLGNPIVFASPMSLLEATGSVLVTATTTLEFTFGVALEEADDVGEILPTWGTDPAPADFVRQLRLLDQPEVGHLDRSSSRRAERSRGMIRHPGDQCG